MARGGGGNDRMWEQMATGVISFPVQLSTCKSLYLRCLASAEVYDLCQLQQC